jgi:hypothetical protein
MQYGQNVRELVQELKRSEGAAGTTADGGGMPAYNDTAVQGALQDFQLHEQALQDQVAIAMKSTTSDDVKRQMRPSLLLQKTACDRTKRGLLMYHMVRLERLKELYHWQSHNVVASSSGSSSTDQNDDNNNKKNLNPAEIQFLQDYRQLVARYTEQALPDGLLVDLRSYSGRPPIVPRDRVLCRVVDETPFDGGPICLESGQTVTFTKGSTYFLLHADVEEYIRSGALQLLDSEEQMLSST